MKKKIYLLVLSVFSLTAFGQFPAPTNFNYTLGYIYMGDAGFCGGNYLTGPAYCSHFSWNTPDLTGTASTLSHYNVHYRSDTSMWNNYFIDTAYITTDTAMEIELGVVGWVWVTAVYNNPDGESDSSDIVYNGDLPINISVQNTDIDLSIHYLQNEKIIIVDDNSKVQKLNIYDLTGKCVQSYDCIGREYPVPNLIPGIYLIELSLKNLKTISRRLLIN